MKYKKVVKAVLATLLVAAFATPNILAYAGNNRDTEFNFYFNKKNETRGTQARLKLDSSSVYVNIIGISPGSVYLYTDGSYGENGPWSNFTVGGSALASRTGKFRIRNTINENARSWAKLTSWNTNDSHFHIYGVWSPDSTGSYTPLN